MGVPLTTDRSDSSYPLESGIYGIVHHWENMLEVKVGCETPRSGVCLSQGMQIGNTLYILPRLPAMDDLFISIHSSLL